MHEDFPSAGDASAGGMANKIYCTSASEVAHEVCRLGFLCVGRGIDLCHLSGYQGIGHQPDIGLGRHTYRSGVIGLHPYTVCGGACRGAYACEG